MATYSAEDPIFKLAVETELRSQEHMLTVAAVAMTALVTFRGMLLEGGPKLVVLLEISWAAFSVCVFVLVLDKVLGARNLYKLARGQAPSKFERKLVNWTTWVAAGTFAVAFTAFGVFGGVNLEVAAKASGAGKASLETAPRELTIGPTSSVADTVRHRDQNRNHGLGALTDSPVTR